MRGGDHDYMMRSEKRPGQRSYSPRPPKRRRKPKRHPAYAILTVLLLLIAYPIGLILLWVPKLRWRAGVKLTVSVVTGIAFFVLMALAITWETGNPTITRLQTQAKDKLTYVMDAARETVSNKERIQTNLLENGPKVLTEGADTLAALAVAGIPVVHDNLALIAHQVSGLTGDVIDWADRSGREFLYKVNLLPTPEPTPTPTPTPEPTPTPQPTPAPSATPESTAQPEGSPQPEGYPEPEESPQPVSSAESKDGAPEGETPAEEGIQPHETAQSALTEPEAIQEVQPSPTPWASQSPSPLGGSRPVTSVAMPTVAPTATLPPPTPSPTPQPTPSPTPIVLPEAKSFADVTVYYYDSSRSYHRNPSCGNMSSAPAHTLAEAAQSGKPACQGCEPPSVDLLTAELAVWCGTDGVFHIDGECAALTSDWTGMTFEAAWLEDGMTGCPLCGADLYVEAHMTANPTPAPAPALEP